MDMVMVGNITSTFTEKHLVQLGKIPLNLINCFFVYTYCVCITHNECIYCILAERNESLYEHGHCEPPSLSL